ncbi:MAG: AsnC family transcriptional regulator [Thaumarchaeota archaeon]|nr:AsnC family transcriptional regulator [Nitrososphaerota archaeon]
MPEADSLYFRILGELYRHPALRESGRESYAQLAKDLGIDDSTVRSALERMQRSGFLKAWSISLNPRALGMECASILVKTCEPVQSKQRIVSQLKLVEGVVLIISFLDDPGFRLVFYYSDEVDLDRKIRLVSSICGVDNPSASWKIPFPRCDMKLKKTDWEIARLIFKDSRKNFSEIAKDIGVSTRTVRRRLTLMAEGSSFFSNPVVDVKKVDGFVYFFLVSYRNTKEKSVSDAGLRKEIERIIFLDSNAELYTVIAAVCKNVSGAEKISDRLKVRDGVKEVLVRVVEDMIIVDDWIDHELEKRARD